MKSIHSFMKCGKKKIYSSESFARKKLRCLENKILDDISLEQKSNILEEMAELFLSLEEYYFANVAIQRALEYSEKSATSAK
ncbi:MAG: hypothetical protein H6622_17300 [Halobacteriovoraceae bacterium]|nr:hypothetical protein [Halobacteriovoraceae bacterium]